MSDSNGKRFEVEGLHERNKGSPLTPLPLSLLQVDCFKMQSIICKWWGLAILGMEKKRKITKQHNNNNNA